MIFLADIIVDFFHDHTKTTFGIVDAQSVKNTDTADEKGYDAGKKVSPFMEERWRFDQYQSANGYIGIPDVTAEKIIGSIF